MPGREDGRQQSGLVDLLKTAVSILAAAGAAYGAIKVDLARTMGDVAYLQQTAARHEASIDRLRDLQASQAAEKQAAARSWPGSK